MCLKVVDTPFDARSLSSRLSLAAPSSIRSPTKPGLLQRSLANAAQQQPGLLGEHHLSHQGTDVSDWIGDHASVVGTQRSRTVMAKANRVPTRVSV